MAAASDGDLPRGLRRLRCGSPLGLNGIPSQCAYTPFWDPSFRSGALLGSGSSSTCSLIYRGRGPEPSSLLSWFLGGYRLDDRALPLGRICKNVSNPLLEVEVVNAVGVCYFHRLLSDHPLAICTQPSCCCCFAQLPTDPDPFSLHAVGKKAAAAVAAAGNRRVTVLEELLPYEALQPEREAPYRTPLLVLPCGAAHSGIELVAVKHGFEDVVYSRQLPHPSSGDSLSKEPGGRLSGKTHRPREEGSSNDGYSTSESESSDSESESIHISEWETSLHAAGCSLGLEGRPLAELHPHTFQWTREEGWRLRREGPSRCERSLSSGSCCRCCCWCPMGAEVDSKGAVRNIFEREDAKHAPHPSDTVKAKESVVSERLLEIKTDDKHPFLKLLFARNARGFYVARLKHSEDALSPEEAAAAVREAARRRAACEAGLGLAAEAFTEGGLRRRLEVQVLHDASYGYRVPRQEGGLARHKNREAGTLRFKVPKQLPAHPTVINIAVSPFDVGEAALLYSSQLVSLWKAEEARMEVHVPLSLSSATRSLRRAARPSMRYRQRALGADPSSELFQTLTYSPHRRQTLLVGSENLWALDLRVKGMTRLFPALHAPTHSSTLQCVAEAFYAPCTTNSSYHTAFTALAPHPSHPFLLAAAHDATEAVYLFDMRAMHEPLTIVGLPTVRKTGSRYRSLLWHSSADQWAEAHEFEFMKAKQLLGKKARAAAVATAGDSLETRDPLTHDLLAAFCWRSEDVVCSAFRVHPAFCPGDSHRSFGSSKPCGDRHDIHSDRSQRVFADYRQDRKQQWPRFEPLPLEAVRQGCLPGVVDQEVVEVSWQAEISMFPRVSWGLQNRERCYAVSSQTPVGAAWTPHPPLHVTVDEHAATGTFHGFAGACVFDLPVTPSIRNALLHEGRAPPHRRPRCRACGARSKHRVSGVGSLPPLGNLFCENCHSPVCGFGDWVPPATGSLAVLAAFTTSGRLACRPLTLNDPLLQLKLQRRRRMYSRLASWQRLTRSEGFAESPSGLFAGLAGNSEAAGLPESIAALLSFHACQTSRRDDTSSSNSTDQATSTEPHADDGAIVTLLGHLQGTSNELRVLPQRLPMLFLQAQLQQSLQRELLFLAALRLRRGQQLQLMRRAQLEGHFGPRCAGQAAEVRLLSFLKQSLMARQISLQWLQKLLAFDFCDSGALRVHRPAFLTEAYDPEPIIQMVLTDARLDEHLNHVSSYVPAREEQMHVEGAEADSLPVQKPAGSSSPSSKATADLAGVDAEQMRARGGLGSNSCGNRPAISSTAFTSDLGSSGSPNQCEQTAVKELLEMAPGGRAFTTMAEVSALPFPTARSRAVFRYAVEAIEVLNHATPEKSLLQLRQADNVLLQDVLLAVQMWRSGVLTDSQTVGLLRPFSASRPCSPCLLDMQRTTLDFGIRVPRSAQEALEAAMGASTLPVCRRPSASLLTGSDEDCEFEKKGVEVTSRQTAAQDGCRVGVAAQASHAEWGYSKVANPALAPIATCCCRVMLDHQFDVHHCAQAAALNELENSNGDSFCETHYPQTDGFQALLEVLKAANKKWLKRPERHRGSLAVRDICFLPQALVDELAETLFLTHEVLLVPRSVRKSGVNANSDAQSAPGDGFSGAAASTIKVTCRNFEERQRLLQGSLPICSTKQPDVSECAENSSTGGSLADTECPLSSPWLPAYCLSRHLYTFIRADRLLADEDQVQKELQRQAWPELLRQQQRQQAREASQATGRQQFTSYPRNPSFKLPWSMQCHLPEHVFEGINRSKWKRLLSGIAVNNVIIADLLRHWRVSALQQLREAHDKQKPNGSREARADEEEASVSPGVSAGGAERPARRGGSVDRELRRLLQLLPRPPEGIPVAFSSAARKQSGEDEISFPELATDNSKAETRKAESADSKSLEADGEDMNASEESALEDIPAGDLSDCPPALREFVFTCPHPFAFTADPEALQPSQVKAVVDLLLGAPKESGFAEGSRWCANDGLQADTGNAKWLQYPEPNVLWPNPLLHNHRLQPFTGGGVASRPSSSAESKDSAEGGGEERSSPEEADIERLQLHLNRLRLEQLWKYSGVHGVSWDEIDDLYVSFRQQQQQRQQQWESRKQQILEYAGLVCGRRLRAQRLELIKSAGVDLEALDEETREQLLVPRSLFRRMTRRLFYKWHDEYFAPWRPGGLQSVLKAYITLRMLQRETNERFLHLIAPSSAAEGGAQQKATTSAASAASKVSDEAAALEERLRSILKRPYTQKPVGSRGSSRPAAGELKQHGSSEAYGEELSAAGEAGGRPWDFLGVGRRRRYRKAPPLTEQRSDCE
ncbi:hypothetical protein Efla_002982 [Eimeria flavescens]